MKIPVISLLLAALSGLAFSDVPRKPVLSTYSKLWTDSPFTTKPPPPTAGPEGNPLDDYALLGISPIGGGKYRVTLINKKKPDERKMVYSDSADSEFKILGVTKKAGDPMGTVVNMSVGSKTGTVSFDEKLLTIAPVAAAKPMPVQPGQPQPVPQPQPGDPRQPRPRVVPPPTIQPPGQPQVPQVQPGQPAQNIQRPERRRN
jgi:hypothetical protein